MQAKVGLTMGGKPTYVLAPSQTNPQWQSQALGDDKRRIAGELLVRLQARLDHSGTLRHYGLGKLYSEEALPHWALGCFWRSDGQPLWRNGDLLLADRQTPADSWQSAENFATELATCLAISPEFIMAAYELGEKEPVGFVLPLLTTRSVHSLGWQSCRWSKFEQGMILLPGDAEVGLRLPLDQLTAADVLLEEALPEFTSPPIRPEQVSKPAATDSIRLALVVAMERGAVQVFLPPIASVRSFADIVTAIEATAEVLDQPICLGGYGPPQNSGIRGFRIVPNADALEVNIYPAESWRSLVHIHSQLDEEAIACGLTSERYRSNGQTLSTGGAHITIGGATPAASPLLRRPDLLRSFITYWQRHPSLSYGFAGQDIGPTSPSPRVDEARHDSLYELELAFLALTPGHPVAPARVNRLLSLFLRDAAGNAHRTELCIDKLHPADNVSQQLGLLKFRGFAMPPQTGLRLLQMLLLRALVAWFWGSDI